MREMRAHVELWERSLAILPDSVFLDIVKNFIGKVPTPFHKPLLTKQLTSLFSSEEFLGRLESSLSRLDKQLLAGTALLGTATQDELCSLFMGVKPYAVLQQQVVNLEERLLLVPDPASYGHKASLLINPLLADRLLNSSLHIGNLFGQDVGPSRRYLRYGQADRRLIRALVSLHIHAALGPLEKSEKQIFARHASTVFGYASSEDVDRLLAYNRLLFSQRVVNQHGKSTVVDVHRAQMILAASDDMLAWYLFSAAWKRTHNTVMTSVQMQTLRKFHVMLRILLERIQISNDDQLERLCMIAALRSGLHVERTADMLHVLHVVGVDFVDADGQEEVPPVRLEPTIDSDLTISFTGDVLPAGGRDILHCLAIVRKVDVVSSYELHKATILRAFDLGLSVPDILGYLQELTRGMPESLERLIAHWKEEFGSITIYDGIVVKTDERFGRIIKALPAMQPHMVSIINDTLFLLSRESEIQWREILASTGVGILPSSISERNTQGSRVAAFDTADESAPSDEDLRGTLDALASDSDTDPVTTDPPFVQELRAAIVAKKLLRQEREELLARLERKLILVPSQIAATDGKSQIMEASGFDFQGKVNLCKAAVNSPTELLELHLLDTEGEARILMSEVKEYIRDVKDPAIRVKILPHGEEKVIQIDKIFKVRKLRRSIFFQF